MVDAEPSTPGAEEILLEVAVSSINPADVAGRSGWMAQYLPMSPPLILGVDVAGTVAAVGSGVSGLAPGDRVYGVAGVPTGGSGAFAELAVTPGCVRCRRS